MKSKKNKLLEFMAKPILASSGLAILASSAWAADAAPTLDKADTSWMLVSSLLVLLMTLPGLALFYGGLVRKDNVLATLMQTFVITCAVSLVWPIIGYSLAFTEGSPWVGSVSKIMLAGVGINSLFGAIPENVFIMFQMTFAIIATAILVGSVADRIKFTAVLLFAVLWVIVVYAPVAHAVWGPGGAIGGVGLKDYAGMFGFGTALDFAGGTVVHITSGISGLVAALVLGKSLNSSQSTSNNLVLSVIGAGLLWVGWFGFNAGSALVAGGQAGIAMLVTNSSAAIAALTWIVVEWKHKGKPSVAGGISGAVAGLVAITPAAGFVDFSGSLIIGIAGGLSCYAAVALLKERLGYDDSLDVFGIHGVGGIIGAILTGVFALKDVGGFSGVLEGNHNQIIAQIIAVVITIVYSGAATYVLLKLVDIIVGLRVSEEVERSGLDLALHGESVHVYK